MKFKVPDLLISVLSTAFGIDLNNPEIKKLQPYSKTLSQVSTGLKKITVRSEFLSQNYLEKSDIRSAYLLYYTPINMVKIFYPLGELLPQIKNKSNLNVLDIGSGLGAMSVGLCFWNEDNLNTTFDITAYDQSAHALKDFSELFTSCKFSHQLKTVTAPIGGTMDDCYDLILAGNLLNELSTDEEGAFESYLDQNLSEEGFAILIEPALPETSRRLLSLRDRLLQKGFFIYAPCFTNNPCPALVKSTDWCHHAMAWERPEYIRLLDEMIGHVKKTLKFSYIIISKNDHHLADHLLGSRDSQNQFRIVSELFKEKGRYEFFGCNDHGWCSCQVNKRDLTDENSAIENLIRYDTIEIQNYKSEKNRIKIDKNTVVKKITQ